MVINIPDMNGYVGFVCAFIKHYRLSTLSHNILEMLLDNW